MENKTRRARLMINWEFQAGFIARFILINTAVMVLFGFFAYLFFNSEVDANLRSAHVAYANMKEMLLPIVLALSIINILVSSAVITLVVLQASHKIAGPLYRFKAALDEMKEGNLRPLVEIRTYDQLYGCVPSLKGMAAQFAADMDCVREGIGKADKALKKKKNKDAEKELGDLNAVINRYKIQRRP